MRWAPLVTIALILAFSNVSVIVQGLAIIVCILAWWQALHFDNQIIIFLSHYIALLKARNKPNA
jgi:hypothetical protein